jgi:hypothetical protein
LDVRLRQGLILNRANEQHRPIFVAQSTLGNRSALTDHTRSALYTGEHTVSWGTGGGAKGVRLKIEGSGTSPTGAVALGGEGA